MRRSLWFVVALAACGTESEDTATSNQNARAEDAGKAADARVKDASKSSSADAGGPSLEGLTLRKDVQPITRAADALPGVFIPPVVSCLPPREGEPPGDGPGGQVCTNVAISGATEPGRSFADYASCEIVITQRPFWSVPPARESDPRDPRLTDDAYLSELAWVTEQVKASGCVCCHDSKVLGKQAGEWDIQAGTLWLDSLPDTGLALFAGLADSTVLGAYRPEDNHGFDRNVVGIPTTDNERMRAFMFAELARRGISEDEARAVPPFGGPIYTNRIAQPTECVAGEGVTPEGMMVWKGSAARYVYVMREQSENPGVPPNLDLPEGTLFKLDVLASEPAIASGVAYGTTPPGSFQAYPESERAAELERGVRYHFYALADVGLPLANCMFTFGEQPAVADAGTASPDAGKSSADAGAPTASTDAGACSLPNDGFGATCKTNDDCPCTASYCALMPGQSTGTCTRTGCNDDPTVCPTGWRCFDLSAFASGLPAICTK